MVDFNKQISGDVVVMFKDAPHDLTQTSLSPVELEDPVFNDSFDVYASNQVEARYILTPAFMRQCLALQKEIGFPINFSVCSGKLYVDVCTHYDFFEPSLMNNPISYDELKLCYHMIKLIHHMVESLQLNMRIWTKT